MTSEKSSSKTVESKTHEWVSAYLDDENSAMERHRNTRALCQDAHARKRLGRYQLVGDAIRGDLPEHYDASFADEVLQSIKQEQVERTPTHWSWREIGYWLWHPAPSVALSGALGIVAIVGIWFYVDRTAQEVAPMEAAVQMAPTAETTLAEMQAQQRTLQSYLGAHAQYAAPQAMLPYRHLIRYEE